MKVRGVKSTTPASTPAPAPAARPAVETISTPKAPSSAKNKTRVLLTVEDGKIEWAKMSPDARRQFEQLFSDEKFLSQFGLIAKNNRWDPEQIKHIYAGMGMALQFLAKLRRMCPAAVDVLGFNEAEKNALAEPTAAVADAYSGEFLKKHSTIVIWGGVFASIVSTKITAAFQLQAEYMAREAAARGVGQVQAPPRPAPAPPRRPAVVDVPAPAPARAAAAAAPAPAPAVEAIALATPEGPSLESLPEAPEMLASLE